MWHIDPRCRIKLGGNYFVNCQELIVYGEASLFTIKRRESDGAVGIDFDIFNAHGKKIATVRHGTIVSGDKQNYDITHNPHHYSLKEKGTCRTICEIRRAQAAQNADLEVAVDLFTSDRFHIRMTPEETNLGTIAMRGSTFSDLKTGIKIEAVKKGKKP